MSVRVAVGALLAALLFAGCIRLYFWAGDRELTLPPVPEPTPTPEVTPTPEWT
ncbi:MAG: hypothetical protein ACREQY_10900 [Candidatus Binatia bacterium]